MNRRFFLASFSALPLVSILPTSLLAKPTPEIVDLPVEEWGFIFHNEIAPWESFIWVSKTTKRGYRNWGKRQRYHELSYVEASAMLRYILSPQYDIDRENHRIAMASIAAV